MVTSNASPEAGLLTPSIVAVSSIGSVLDSSSSVASSLARSAEPGAYDLTTSLTGAGTLITASTEPRYSRHNHRYSGRLPRTWLLRECSGFPSYGSIDTSTMVKPSRPSAGKVGSGVRARPALRQHTEGVHTLSVAVDQPDFAIAISRQRTVNAHPKLRIVPGAQQLNPLGTERGAGRSGGVLQSEIAVTTMCLGIRLGSGCRGVRR